MGSKNPEDRKIEGEFLLIFLPKEQKIASNNREVRKIEGSKNRDSTVGCHEMLDKNKAWFEHERIKIRSLPV